MIIYSESCLHLGKSFQSPKSSFALIWWNNLNEKGIKWSSKFYLGIAAIHVLQAINMSVLQL